MTSKKHMEKGNLYRLSLIFTALAFMSFMLGVLAKYGTTRWTMFGVLGILFMAAAFTSHYLHEAKKESEG